MKVPIWWNEKMCETVCWENFGTPNPGIGPKVNYHSNQNLKVIGYGTQNCAVCGPRYYGLFFIIRPILPSGMILAPRHVKKSFCWETVGSPKSGFLRLGLFLMTSVDYTWS